MEELKGQRPLQRVNVYGYGLVLQHGVGAFPGKKYCRACNRTSSSCPKAEGQGNYFGMDTNKPDKIPFVLKCDRRSLASQTKPCQDTRVPARLPLPCSLCSGI